MKLMTMWIFTPYTGLSRSISSPCHGVLHAILFLSPVSFPARVRRWHARARACRLGRRQLAPFVVLNEAAIKAVIRERPALRSLPGAPVLTVDGQQVPVN